MPFEEKVTWVSLVVGIVVPIWYFATVLGQLGETAAADIAYQRPLVIAIIASIVLTIAGAIATGIATGIGGEVRAEITAQATGQRPATTTDEIGRSDERDADISRRGDLIGFYAASAGLVVVLVITMLEYDHFWIANALYLSFVIASLVSGVAKIVAYRRGF